MRPTPVKPTPIFGRRGGLAESFRSGGSYLKAQRKKGRIDHRLRVIQLLRRQDGRRGLAPRQLKSGELKSFDPQRLPYP